MGKQAGLLSRRLQAGRIDPGIEAGRGVGLPRLLQQVEFLAAGRKVGRLFAGLLGEGDQSLLERSGLLESAASLDHNLLPHALVSMGTYRRAVTSATTQVNEAKNFLVTDSLVRS